MAFFKPSDQEEKVLLAGQKVPAGRYRQVVTGRVFVFENEEVLPASFDGHIACSSLLPAQRAARLDPVQVMR